MSLVSLVIPVRWFKLVGYNSILDESKNAIVFGSAGRFRGVSMDIVVR
jgi:hypothetical protein